jgi:hypothetical protein
MASSWNHLGDSAVALLVAPTGLTRFGFGAGSITVPMVENFALRRMRLDNNTRGRPLAGNRLGRYSSNQSKSNIKRSKQWNKTAGEFHSPRAKIKTL